jgi:hypothetical protein
MILAKLYSIINDFTFTGDLNFTECCQNKDPCRRLALHAKVPALSHHAP